MRTISQAVEEIIQRSPFLAEAMAEGVANNAQIARKIKKEVEARLYEKVSEAAIAMALHRMGKKFRRAPYSEKLIKQMNDITVRSNLVEFVYANSDSLNHVLDVLGKHMAKRKDSFLNFSHGLHESLIVVNTEFESEVERALKGEKQVEKMTGLSAITMRLPEQSLAVPGMYYPILKAIAEEGISFEEVMSVRTEFSIIFKDEYVDRAFSVLKRITS